MSEPVSLLHLVELAARGDLSAAWEESQRLSADPARLFRRHFDTLSRLVRTARTVAADSLRLAQALRAQGDNWRQLRSEGERAIASSARRLSGIVHQAMEARRQIDRLEEIGRDIDRTALNSAINAARMGDAAETLVPAFEEIRRSQTRLSMMARELSDFVEAIPDLVGAAGRDLDALLPLAQNLDSPSTMQEPVAALIRGAQALTAATATFRVPAELGIDETAALRERLREQRQALEEEVERVLREPPTGAQLAPLVELLEQAVVAARRATPQD